MAEILVPVPQNVRNCAICGKQFEKDILLVKDSDLCPECRKTYHGMAFVYCNTCKKVICRVTPGLSASGYLVKPYELLHVSKCPICCKGVAEVVPEEFKAYEKGR